MASWTAASVVRWALLKNCTFEENSRRNPIVIIPCLVHLGKVRYNSIHTGAAGQVVGHGDDSGGRRQLPLDQVNIISLAQGLRFFFMSHFLKQSKIYVFLACVKSYLYKLNAHCSKVSYRTFLSGKLPVFIVTAQNFQNMSAIPLSLIGYLGIHLKSCYMP